MPGWVPRGVDPASREVLIEGVPSHLKPALLAWMKPHLSRHSQSVSRWFFLDGVLREFDLVARWPRTLASVAGTVWPGNLGELDEESLLDLADWLAHRSSERDGRELENMLSSASSAWRVGTRNGNAGLIRRVPESVTAAAGMAVQQGSAGSLLGEAWSACFGRVADPEEAYEKSIKAVEAAGVGLVSPRNLRATLGTMLRDMRAQANWHIDLPGNQTDVAISMIEALWTGQESRHGGNNYRVPTQQEAETAVFLAVPLVQWFTNSSLHQIQRPVDT